VQDGATTPEIIEPLSKQVNDSHSSRFIIKLDDSIWTLTTSRISRPDIGCETRRLANPRFSTHRDRPARAFSELIFFREVDHSSPEGPRVCRLAAGGRRIRTFGPPSEGFMQTPEIAADREHRRRRSPGKWRNADLAPLGGQRHCSPAAADRPNWPGFAFALARARGLTGIKWAIRGGAFRSR
jgi:hypothetical protein